MELIKFTKMSQLKPEPDPFKEKWRNVEAELRYKFLARARYYSRAKRKDFFFEGLNNNSDLTSSQKKMIGLRFRHWQGLK